MSVLHFAKSASGTVNSQIEAHLGATPMVTLVDKNDVGAAASVRLMRCGDVWLGLVGDACQLAQRVRVGAELRFTAAPLPARALPASVLCGDGHARLRGRATDAVLLSAEAVVLRALCAQQPFGLNDAVLLEFSPASVEAPAAHEATGAVPRT